MDAMEHEYGSGDLRTALTQPSWRLREPRVLLICCRQSWMPSLPRFDLVIRHVMTFALLTCVPHSSTTWAVIARAPSHSASTRTISMCRKQLDSFFQVCAGGIETLATHAISCTSTALDPRDGTTVRAAGAHASQDAIRAPITSMASRMLLGRSLLTHRLALTAIVSVRISSTSSARADQIW